jgi:hypothetical protein
MRCFLPICAKQNRPPGRPVAEAGLDGHPGEGRDPICWRSINWAPACAGATDGSITARAIATAS